MRELRDLMLGQSDHLESTGLLSGTKLEGLQVRMWTFLRHGHI